AADVKDRVPHRLEVQPMAVHLPKVAIVGVDLREPWILIAALLIRTRTHDQPMQLFQRPAVLDEPRCQIIQKLRMRRRLRARAEVVRRADNSLPEMMQPYAIRNHPRGEGIVRAGNFFRQFQPAAANFEWFAWARVLSRERHKFEELSRDHGS